MCTIFAQKLEDVQIERFLDRHIGHSTNVAQKHYEMIQKEMDACETSNAVDRIIKVSEETEDQIKIVAAQAEETNEDDDLSESSDEENQISSENDSCSDYSTGEDYKKPPAKNKKAPLKVNLPLGSSLGITDGIPTESAVCTFLRSRPQRQEFKKETYAVRATEFVRREKGLGKNTIAQLAKEVLKNQLMKYGTVQYVLKTIYELKNAGYPSSW